MRRRSFLAGSAALPLAPPAAAAGDEEGHWREVTAQYDLIGDILQFEHGNWGMMARPTMAVYRAHQARLNRETSFYARRTMNDDLAAVQARAAAALGVAPAELALTRNATEALRAAILQYNRLRPGDTVLWADLDYDSMQACMAALAKRCGAAAVTIGLPLPATRQAVLDAYAAAFAAHPRLRLVLLTHVSHRTGLVLPVREIVAMARARGIDCIVDAAHSVGQLDFALPDLGADFVGVNFHKWFGAPLGVGGLYVREECLDAIDPDPAEPGGGETIRARVHTGTLDYAAHLSLPTALDFLDGIGLPRRAARLKALRDRWVTAVRDIPEIEVLTPDEPGSHGAITSFRLRGQTSSAANRALAKRLLDEHRIFTVHRDGLASGSCVRVTPALATPMAQCDALAAALRAVAAA